MIERVEILRIGHARGACTRALRIDRGPSVKATAPACFQQADLGDLLAVEAAGESAATGRTRTTAGVARPAQQKIDDRRLVDRRIGVGPREDRRDAARRGRRRRRGDRLAMLGARLADEGAHVDEARRDDIAGAIDDMRVRRQRRGATSRPEIADHAVDDRARRRASRSRATGSISRALTSASG